MFSSVSVIFFSPVRHCGPAASAACLPLALAFTLAAAAAHLWVSV